ncbi:MAG: hydrogen gas-evolving membrane-bound hydrogenase subunit E [Phototrophicaceae bacterium]
MDLLILIALPFAIALLLAIPGVGRVIPKQFQTALLTLTMLGSFVWLVSYFPKIQATGVYAPPPLVWVADLGLTFSVYLDGLSLLFALVVTGVGTVIFLYTHFYFEDAEAQRRFTVWLSAFTGAMLGLVLAGNLLLLFIMWELTSITSFMLIGFYGDQDQDARVAAQRALIITGGGGLALLVGVLLIGAALGGGNGVLVFDYATLLNTSLADHRWYAAILTLVALGAFTKSAQWPFHFWLPGAMTAPTPASAFLHSATMVKAGVYLLARLYPTLYDNVLWTNVLLSVGLLTMTISVLFALKQRDLKGMLAYSTTAWLGTLIALIALPDYAGFKALAIGILAHALYKSALFLSVGTIDHMAHTRIIDELGGLWRKMPLTLIVVIISALSMAGVPLLFGFVSKEVLLDATIHYMTATFLGQAALWLVFVAAALNGTVAYILIWDVFFAPSKQEHHLHAMPRWTMVAPLVLAVGGTLILPFLLAPLIVPLVEQVTPKPFELHLIPEWGLEFQLSLAAIAVGFAAFLVRAAIVEGWQFLPFNGVQLYAATIEGVEQVARRVTATQNGKIRYYLFIILGVVAVILNLAPSFLGGAFDADFMSALQITRFDSSTLLSITLLLIAVVSLAVSVVVKRQFIAALAVGVFGYAVGGVFILEQAPDVALVQFLIETLSTVLIVIMISRISHRQRKAMADALWTSTRGGILRDALISVGIGFSVFVFALVALVNRPERTTITDWYVANTVPELGFPDIVGAIVTDFRGMDTFIEIAVFGMAALGVLSLLALHREDEDRHELPPQASGARTQAIGGSTALVKVAARLLLPLALLLGMAQVLYGGGQPGDGFTAGVVGGLTVALGYVVFGYYSMQDELLRLQSLPILICGLVLSILNAVLPLALGKPWMAHLSWDAFSFAGLHITSTQLFEFAIMFTVFGAVGVIMETIAHPRDVEVLAGDEAYDPNYAEGSTVLAADRNSTINPITEALP